MEFPDRSEPEKAMANPTDLGDCGIDDLAWLYNKAGSHAVDNPLALQSCEHFGGDCLHIAHAGNRAVLGCIVWMLPGPFRVILY